MSWHGHRLVTHNPMYVRVGRGHRLRWCVGLDLFRQKARGMSEFESSPHILSVGARLANRLRTGGDANTQSVAQVAEVNLFSSAMNVMRAMKFDLLAVGDRIEEETPWDFVQQMRSAWPRQKWVYLADAVTDEDEIKARSLGAVAVLEGAEAWHHTMELANKLRAARPHSAVAGLRLRLNEKVAS